MFNQIFGHPMAQSSWHKKLIYTHWFSSYLILWLTPVFYCILSKAIFAWPLSPWGLSRRLSGKKSAYQAGDTVSISGLGRSPGGGNGNPLQFSLLENFTDREASGYSPWGHERVRHNWAYTYLWVKDKCWRDKWIDRINAVNRKM